MIWLIRGAQQADSFLQHALNITGTKAVAEHVDPSTFPSSYEAVRLLHSF